MFSKILIKLIDQAIIPALLLLATRIISLVLVSKYVGANISLQAGGFTFSNPDDYILINSYSMFAMVSILVLGLSFVLIKSLVFHDTHISPSTTAKVFSYRMSSLIQSSYDLYTQGAIWMSYTYLLTIIAGIMAVYGLIYRWVFTVSFLLTVLSTVLLILDVEHEVKIVKRKDPELDMDWSDYLETEGEAENA
ncbi:hypothetical protein JXA34_03965 [Patescibacteria group bacterium]|nr:hypothetical protein [Patescibacteria group bacterium]